MSMKTFETSSWTRENGRHLTRICGTINGDKYNLEIKHSSNHAEWLKHNSLIVMCWIYCNWNDYDRKETQLVTCAFTEVRKIVYEHIRDLSGTYNMLNREKNQLHVKTK